VTLDSFRSKASAFIDPAINVFSAFHITPNMLSMVSLLAALVAGICFLLSNGNSLVLFIAVVMILLNAFLDGADGVLARKSGTVSVYGDFLDHVIDRYADFFILAGICLGGYLPASLGILVIAGVLLASYLGTQAQAVGVGRVYAGIMGRADRLVILLLATILNIVYMAPIGIWGFELPLLGWALVIIGIGSHITALQRIWVTRKALLQK
jgi:phosphatidylglycerophosphate synthase